MKEWGACWLLHSCLTSSVSIGFSISSLLASRATPLLKGLIRNWVAGRLKILQLKDPSEEINVRGCITLWCSAWFLCGVSYQTALRADRPGPCTKQAFQSFWRGWPKNRILKDGSVSLVDHFIDTRLHWKRLATVGRWIFSSTVYWIHWLTRVCDGWPDSSGVDYSYQIFPPKGIPRRAKFSLGLY